MIKILPLTFSPLLVNRQHFSSLFTGYGRRGGKIAVVLSVSREKILLNASIGCKSANSINENDLFSICKEFKVTYNK